MITRRPSFGGGLAWRRLATGLTLLGACVLIGLFGCRDEVAQEVDTNVPPDTYLTGVPAESTISVYYAHLYWYGNDADGEVVGFEYAVADSEPADEDTLTYRYTTKTDSVFRLPVGQSQQVLGHRIYMRAIDNEGAVDPEPAWAFFGAADLVAPTAILTLAEAFDPLTGETMALTDSVNTTLPSDTIPAGWDVRFAWSGYDGDEILDKSGTVKNVGSIVSYQHWLAPRESSPNASDLEDTTRTIDDLESARYQFNVRAIDDAGYAGLDPTFRSFVWNKDPNTLFERGFEPESGDSVAHFFATSTAWEGEREFFSGDTVPLKPGGFTLAPVTIRTSVNGSDPDDVLAAGVTNFEYRTGAGRWSAVPANGEIVVPNRLTTVLQLEARCRDGFGRKDGTPARMVITINQAPRLLDTLAVEGGEPILQYPLPGQVVPLDSLVVWGFRMPLRLRAVDPDTTTTSFGYAYRTTGFLYGEEVTPGAGQIFETQITVPDAWRRVGTYTIGVRVRERAPGDPNPRFVEVGIPFRIE